MQIQHDGGFAVALVDGLSMATGAAHSDALRDALARYAVVCVRLGRPLTHEEFAAVAGWFGPIKDPVATTRDGGRLRYSPTRQVIDAGFVLTEERRQAHGAPQYGGLDDRRPGLFETYHCDDTFTEAPAQATVLHARALPPSGGGPTHFIDMRAVLAGLDEATRRQVAHLEVVYCYNNDDAFPPRRAASGPADALVEVTHPLVRRHPVAGTQALFVDLDRAHRIEGMDLVAGRQLLQRLQDLAEATAPSCHHDWHDHDVLVWDNGSVQHKAEGNFIVGEPRRFWRHMIAGPRPRR